MAAATAQLADCQEALERQRKVLFWLFVLLLRKVFEHVPSC